LNAQGILRRKLPVPVLKAAISVRLMDENAALTYQQLFGLAYGLLLLNDSRSFAAE